MGMVVTKPVLIGRTVIVDMGFPWFPGNEIEEWAPGSAPDLARDGDSPDLARDGDGERCGLALHEGLWEP